MTTPVLDGALVRRRRAALGLSARAVAASLGVSGTVVTRLENGMNHAEVSVAQVARLAELLGVDVTDLFLDAHSDAPDDDVAALGALLHESDVVAPAGALREALGWTPKRLSQTLDALDNQLRRVGMRLSRVANRYRIVRDLTAASEGALADLLRAHVARDGLNLTEASMLARVARGDVPREPTNPETVAIGTLLNAGLVEPGPAPARHSEKPLLLTAEVRFSLLLDELALGA